MTNYDTVIRAARSLGKIEHDMAEEWLRLAATGTNTYAATQQVAVLFAEEHRLQRAQYDIVLADYTRRI